MEYNFRETEAKWQKFWKDNKPFAAQNNSSKEKYYVLDMFPYPSGAGLHVGHPLGYIASDIVSRYKRHKGFNVLHPMGYDSFGLPAEQYAIQTGQHPAITTEKNIARYREQLDKIGFSFDWDREVRTSNPNYYKWTQWIFIKLFHSWYNPATNKAEPIDTLIPSLQNFSELSEKEKSDLLMNYRLAYLSEAWVNWCPQLGTVLANEEVKDGVSERGGYPVERKLMPQWSLRITAYADRLLNDLETLDWSESIKEAQRNWIGKSEGSSLRFDLSPNPSPQERGTPLVQEPMAEYFTTDKKSWHLLIDNAKQMRSNPTKAEKILWEKLRAHQSGFKFRRQHIVDKFIVDFVCLSKMLVIEVDGDIHDLKKEEDQQRTVILNDAGFKVIRVSNDDVTNDTDVTVEKIIDHLKEQKNYPLAESSIELVKEAEQEYSISSRKVRSSASAEKRSPSLEERGLGGEVIEVFTTRPDTVFGVSFLTLAPEHELIETITPATHKDAVATYLDYAKNRSERERMADVKKITGVFTGAYAIHPFTKKQIPIWIGEYVLAGYGTGAVMGVPAHDERDYAFAKHFDLEIKEVVLGGDISLASYDAKEGKLVNSDFLNGLEVKAAIKKCIEEIEKKNIGKGKTNYRLRDAIFGRQRYWGEPIPIYYKNGIPHTLPENELPLVLPEVDKYLPTESGEPPLARASSNWKYKGEYNYEPTTMPGWAGSSWYFLRYMDANNPNEFVSKEAANYWSRNGFGIDLYIGGSEHATGHLLYVRFWTKFLYDCGYIPTVEPAKKLINQGMIQGIGLRAKIINVFDDSKIREGKGEKTNTLTPFDLGVIKSDKKGFMKTYRTCKILLPLNFPQTSLVNEVRIPYEIAKFADGKYYIDEETINIINTKYSHLKDLIIADIDFLQANLDSEVFEKIKDSLKTERIYLTDEVEKMSKSKWNVVTPDDIIEKYGADCLRMYEMFLGPLEQSKPWNTNGISGVSNFIRKLSRLFHQGDVFTISDEQPTKGELKILHKTIKKVTDDIEKFSFNTSVSSFMICVNELTDLKCNKREILEPLCILISPYAPHIAEELWNKLGHTDSITHATFPIHNEEYLTENSFDYPVSVNGKTRFKINYALNKTKEEIEKEVVLLEDLQKHLNGGVPKKIIVVPGKIINIVI